MPYVSRFCTLTLVVLSLLICVASTPTQAADTKASSDKPAAGSVTPSKPAEVSKWTYGNFVDRMTDEKQERYAELISDNVLNLKFPYNGGVTATLRVYNDKKHGPHGTIQFSRNASVASGMQPRIRFDDGPVMKVIDDFGAPGWGSEDGKGMSFYKRTNPRKQDFFALLKKSKHLKIEVLVLDNGSQILEFSPAGLDPTILPDSTTGKSKKDK